MYRSYKVRSRKYRRLRKRHRKFSKLRSRKTYRIAKKALRAAKTAKAAMQVNTYAFSQQNINTVGVTGYLNNWNLTSAAGAYGYAANQLFFQNPNALLKQRAYHLGMTVKMMMTNNTEPDVFNYSIALVRPTKVGAQRIATGTGYVNGNWDKGKDYDGAAGQIIWNTKWWKILWMREGTMGTSANMGATNAIKRWTVRMRNRHVIYNPDGLENTSLDQWAYANRAPKLTDNVYLFVLTDDAAIDEQKSLFNFTVYHQVEVGT